MSGNLKTIHRIYFNFQNGPDIFAEYLKNWEDELPDFEIKHWNASNLPMDINPWVQELYEKKDHAFLSDYFRWYLLREYGGVYLDADIEVVNASKFRSIIEDLARADDHDAVIGIDERSGGWYTAHSMASKPQSDIARYMCDLYNGMAPFIPLRKTSHYFFAPQLTGLYFANKGHNTKTFGTTPNLNEEVTHERVRILPQDWFSPLAPAPNCIMPFMLNALSANSALCHHFACTWHDDGSKYLDYSRQSGGQACKTVADLLKDGRIADFPADGNALHTAVGNILSDGIVTTGRPGHIMFGPYMTLYPGKYEAVIHLKVPVDIRSCKIDMVASGSDDIIAEASFSSTGGKQSELKIKFDLSTIADKLEVRLWVDARTDLVVKHLSIFARPS